MNKMKIEIWSDIACPYCYIGKHKLKEALKIFPHKDEIEIVRHSYELNPDLPKKPLGKSIYQFMAEQYETGVEQQKENMNKLSSKAKSTGLEFNFDILVVTNTSDALRLIKLADKYKLANEMEEALFKAYFSEGKCISDKDILISSGKEVGLGEQDIINVLESDLYLKEIKDDIAYSEEKLDLQFIPFYLFNNNDIIQGSLNVDEYTNILNKSYALWKEKGSEENENKDRISGQACSIDGVCSL